MKVIRATDMGMCFGVRDALEVIETIDDPTQVTIHGELVHNPRVIERLATAGFHQQPENARQDVGATSTVLITAHGVSERERSRLREAHDEVIDTTCPLVRVVHDAALELEAEGRLVIVIGKRGHVEVQGVIDDLERWVVVADTDQVSRYPSRRLGVVCQTTMPQDVVDAVSSEIMRCNDAADIRFIDTVCEPTKKRQRAILDLIGQVDVVVVVGGHNSNNTRRLVDMCTRHGVPAWHIACADEIDPSWFTHVDAIGLTAGTSTLDETIDEVEESLMRLSAARAGDVWAQGA